MMQRPVRSAPIDSEITSAAKMLLSSDVAESEIAVEDPSSSTDG